MASNVNSTVSSRQHAVSNKGEQVAKKQVAKQQVAKEQGGDAAAAAASAADAPYELSAAREAELLEKAAAMADKDILPFPGKLARRVAWSARIQSSAERDAADLVLTPFDESEAPLTLEEIKGQRDQIELMRRRQSRWAALSGGQREATVRFVSAAREAAEHRASLLRFFDLRFRNNPEGQRRVSAIREGNGDPDLVQDVSDVLVLCSEHQAAVNAGPKGEGAAAARLAELSPMLVRLLADKTLSPEVAAARRARDAVYTMVVHTERRIRDAAAYWYGGTERMKEYAAYPTHAGRGSTGAGEDEGEGDSAADEVEEAARV